MVDQQKYFTELNLLQATKSVIAMRPAQLYELDIMAPADRELLEGMTIYFVCERPRIRIVDVEARKEATLWTLAIGTPSGLEERTLRLDAPPGRWDEVRIHKDGTCFTLASFDGEETAFVPIEALAGIAFPPLPEIRDLRVVYIGQSVDSARSRNPIADRLLSHSKLQKILVDHSQRAWWMETVLVLFGFDDPFLVMSMDGRGKPEITGEEDRAHYLGAMEKPPTHRDLVTITEASLISYFQPPYNVHFAKDYPVSNMKHLQSAYRTDYCAITTEVDTEDIGMTIRSDAQPGRHHHIAAFDLHSEADRLSFFKLSAAYGEE